MRYRTSHSLSRNRRSRSRSRRSRSLPISLSPVTRRRYTRRSLQTANRLTPIRKRHRSNPRKTHRRRYLSHQPLYLSPSPSYSRRYHSGSRSHPSSSRSYRRHVARNMSRRQQYASAVGWLMGMCRTIRRRHQKNRSTRKRRLNR